LTWLDRRAAHKARSVAVSALIGALSFSGGCRTKSRLDAPDPPRVACDDAAHDFGDVVQGERLTHAFRLRNTGPVPLRIDGVTRSYGCAAVKPPEWIRPHEGADLDVACETDGRQDRFADKLVVHSNDPLVPELAIEVAARVEPLLALASRTAELRTAFGETASQDVELTGRLATAARLAIESVDPPGPEVKVIAGERGKPERLRVILAGTRVGRHAGQVSIRTGLDKPRALTLLYSSQVLGNLSVDPTNPYIDLRAPQPVGVVVHVSSSRDDFRLDDARVIGRCSRRREPHPGGRTRAARHATADEQRSGRASEGCTALRVRGVELTRASRTLRPAAI
jgi:hypothetical protein